MVRRKRPAKNLKLKTDRFDRLPVPKISSSLYTGSLAKGFLRKVCGNCAENSQKLAKKYVVLRQERVRKVCGNFAEIC